MIGLAHLVDKAILRMARIGGAQGTPYAIDWSGDECSTAHATDEALLQCAVEYPLLTYQLVVMADSDFLTTQA